MLIYKAGFCFKWVTYLCLKYSPVLPCMCVDTRRDGQKEPSGSPGTPETEDCSKSKCDWSTLVTTWNQQGEEAQSVVRLQIPKGPREPTANWILSQSLEMAMRQKDCI